MNENLDDPYMAEIPVLLAHATSVRLSPCLCSSYVSCSSQAEQIAALSACVVIPLATNSCS